MGNDLKPVWVEKTLTSGKIEKVLGYELNKFWAITSHYRDWGTFDNGEEHPSREKNQNMSITHRHTGRRLLLCKNEKLALECWGKIKNMAMTLDDGHGLDDFKELFEVIEQYAFDDK